ncbi:hypothetical protein TEA_016736 [Camellia sinensis var. sinensis]|uniref:Cytochrome P450 n=1 Tax=Camellia sinensis var. sinensis TaxID=542762 RepID=A0A4S4EB80_CAMSN|nr:hypothetical protein TEA_016736 [Camellia sinensis var. sinensis]
MRMEGSELGVVEAKADREVPERAGIQGKSIQTVVWRHKRDDINNKSCKIQSHGPVLRRYYPTRPTIPPLLCPTSRFLPTKTNTKIKTIYEEVRSLMRNIIINKKKRTMKGDGDNDLLGILLKTNLKASQEQGNKKNITLTTDEVIEECKLFYFAGQETTSALLVWTMYLLSKHQKWQALAREEALAVFGDNKPTYEGLNQLKTITMILYEVLRLYPPAAHILRAIHKPTRLGELVLPAGVEFTLPVMAIQHDPEIWGEDALEFKPERFSEGITKATKGQGTFFPFSGGPRICIGQNFAMLESKIALATILRHFTFQLSPSYVHSPFNVVTIQPQHGAQFILQKI